MKSMRSIRRSIYRSEQASLSPECIVTRASLDSDDGTAQPSLTSGFGSLMEEEHDLQASITQGLDVISGPRSNDVRRILRNQQVRLSANIALLEQRYEMLPHPARFNALHAPLPRLTKTGHSAASCESSGVLPSLIAQHESLLGKIDVLIEQGADGQRGEIVLTEVARNHEGMVRLLSALQQEDETARDSELVLAAAADVETLSPGKSAGNWENEGGAPL